MAASLSLSPWFPTSTPIFAAQDLAARLASEAFGDGLSCAHTKHRRAVQVTREYGVSAVTTGEDSALAFPEADPVSWLATSANAEDEAELM